jgi:zinc metalloprotease ZmpB
MKIKIQLSILILLFFQISVFAQKSENETVARQWIAKHSEELNIQPFHTFKLTFVRKGLAGETLRFQQMLNDVPVYQSEIVLHFNKENQISFSSNSFDEKILNINTNPTISLEVALKKATDNLKLNDSFSFQDSKLVVYNKLSETKLVYIITTNPNSGIASWESVVDAQTGLVLNVKDVAIYYNDKSKSKKKKKSIVEESRKYNFLAPNFVTGTALIYNPDPLSQTGSLYAGNYVDNNDATNAQLDAARISVTLPEIDLTGGVYKLKSSYVNIQDFELPTTGLFTQSTSAFNFDRSQNAFEAVNAFYHLDKSMRYINETLGINCKPNANGGVLFFDSSGLSGADNSHYLPSSDKLAFGEGGVDDAEDADVVLHELGHGLHDWLTNGSTSDKIGEGSGDYWAQSYSRSLNQWSSSEPSYNYMFSWDGHNPFWDGRTTDYGPIYPSGLVGGSGHTDGQIWVTVLMKIWDAIGRTKTDKAFLEGLALTNNTSNQEESAIAVRQAGIDLNFPCADIQTMTVKFNGAGYTMPAVALAINCPTTQNVNVGGSGTYSVPSFSSLSNAISANCSAVVTQSPAIGTNLTPGTYPVTMTATSGTQVSCNFNLVVSGALATNQVEKIKNFVMYPNPASTILTLLGEFDANENISIYNLLGQKVMDKDLKSNQEKLDVSKLSNGVYTIYFNISKSTEKFIKQ